MDKTIHNQEDTRKLISFVRQTPQIYASARVNVRKRSSCWIAIASRFKGKFSATECRRKWKSLKDSFKKYLKQRINGRHSQWIFAKDLDFIYEFCINEMSNTAQRKCNDIWQLQNRVAFRHVLHGAKGTFDNSLTELLPESVTGCEVIDINSSKLNCDLKDFYDFSEFGIESVSYALPTEVAESMPLNHDAGVELPSELDNFFDFLKNRVQSLTKERIPEAQAKLMACVLSVERNFESRY